MPRHPLLDAVRHAPRPTPELDDITLFAHRGWSGRFPENTHAAFAAAVERGWPLELDVQLSADGTPWVIHDASLDRTTDLTGWVDGTSDAHLARADAGGWAGPDHAGERLPRLDEVLEAYGDRVLLDVEIKPPRRGGRWTARDVAGVVAQRLAAHALTERVVVTSFNPFVLEALRHRAPQVRRGQLTSRFRGADLERPFRFVLRHLLLDGRAQADLVVAEAAMLTPRLVTALRDRGFRVWTYTVDDPAEAPTLRDRGVQAIISNHPDAVGG